MGLLALTSDFGVGGPYVGQMKAAALSVSPTLQVVDLWHGVPAHQVSLAALLLPRMWRRFPPGTVHVAVVDPGVGTERPALVVSWDGYLLVGPDNGLFSTPIAKGGRVRTLDPDQHGRKPLSATFHGRDLFAPAGAALASGSLLFSDLAEPSSPPVRLDLLTPRLVRPGLWQGEVIWVDSFGNLVTNIPGEYTEGRPFEARLGGLVVLGKETYSQVEEGELLALEGSFGLMEIACRNGSAFERLNFRVGTSLQVAISSADSP